MCRFALYLGPPITLDLLTTRPVHSIIRQSFKSRMREEPLNGDGFGIAWYVPDVSPEPAQFRSVQPAWNNVNLLHLARVNRSPAILAHVRAATPGLGVSQANCHPFVADRFAFMHNGSVADFQKIKRELRATLSDEAYGSIQGTTDSEHLFARFRDHVRRLSGADQLDSMANALAATIRDVEQLSRAVDARRDSLLNLAVSDGQRAVVSRYASGDSEPPSLYLRTGTQYVCERGVCRMLDDGDTPTTVIVASEPLTKEASWDEVPNDHMVLIDSDYSVTMREIN